MLSAKNRGNRMAMFLLAAHAAAVHLLQNEGNVHEGSTWRWRSSSVGTMRTSCHEWRRCPPREAACTTKWRCIKPAAPVTEMPAAHKRRGPVLSRRWPFTLLRAHMACRRSRGHSYKPEGSRATDLAPGTIWLPCNPVNAPIFLYYDIRPPYRSLKGLWSPWLGAQEMALNINSFRLSTCSL